VNTVTPALFKRYPDARALARATSAELEPQIHSTGFFRAKSKSLIGMAQSLVAQHDGEVPATMEALVELPGVGRKTANVVLGHALGIPGLPVDRHVLRVANRIGIAESDDPIVVEQQLCDAMPPERWTRTSDTLILHGRRICRPKPAVRRVLRARRVRLLPARRLARTRTRAEAPVHVCAKAARRGQGARRRGQVTRRRRRPARRPSRAHRRQTPTSKRRAGTRAGPRDQAESQWSEARSKSSSLRRSDRSRASSARRCGTSRSSWRTSRRKSCSARWRSRRPIRLLGLYSGVPLTERSWRGEQRMPDRILIFQGPHERDSRDDDDLVVAIAETLIHEVGHYFGMSEEEIEEIEEHYWRSEAEE